MSAYFHEFTPLEPTLKESFQAYREAFLDEDEETEQESIDRWSEFPIPLDYIDFATNHGLNRLVWQKGERTFTFCFPEDVRIERETLVESFPHAFPIARDDVGDYFLFAEGFRGLGLYTMGDSGSKGYERYLSPSFSSFFLEGIGVDKLLSD